MRTGRLALVMLVSLFIFFSCKKESNPLESEAITSEGYRIIKTMTIGKSGGIIESGDVSVKIPANSLSGSTEIKILESDSLYFREGQLSKGYSIDGLPSGYTGDVQIKIKYTGITTYQSYLALVTPSIKLSNSKAFKEIKYLLSKDSSGFIISTRSYKNYVPLAKSSVNYAAYQKDFVVVKSASKMIESDHFTIMYSPNEFSDGQAYLLQSSLESSYKIYNDIGFDLVKKGFTGKLPIEVYKDASASEYGYYARSLPALSPFFGYIGINASKMSDDETLKATSTHELFHYVQDLYSVNDNNTYPMQEALSTWSEELILSNANYTPATFMEHWQRPLHGLEAGRQWNDPSAPVSDNSKRQNHGYGMGGFIKYLVTSSQETDKRKTTLNILKQLETGKNNIDAIKASIGTLSFNNLVNGYFDSFMQGNIFKGVPLAFMTLDACEGKKFDIQTAADSVKTFQVEMPDLSASAFNINLKRSFFDMELIKLTYTSTGLITNHNYYVYKILQLKKPELISYGTFSNSPVTISGIRSIYNAGANLVVLVTNTNSSQNYLGTANCNLKVHVGAENNTPKTVSLGSLTLNIFPAETSDGDIKVFYQPDKILVARSSGTIIHSAEISWIAPPSGNIEVAENRSFMNQIFTIKLTRVSTGGSAKFDGATLYLNGIDETTGWYQDWQQTNESSFGLFATTVQKTLPASATSTSVTATLELPVTMSLVRPGGPELNIDGKIIFSGSIRDFWASGDNIPFTITYTYKD